MKKRVSPEEFAVIQADWLADRLHLLRMIAAGDVEVVNNTVVMVISDFDDEDSFVESIEICKYLKRRVSQLTYQKKPEDHGFLIARTERVVAVPADRVGELWEALLAYDVGLRLQEETEDD